MSQTIAVRRLRPCLLSMALSVILILAGCVVPVPMPPVTPTPTSVEGEVLPFETIARRAGSCETYDSEAIFFFVTTPEKFDQLLAQLPAPGDSRVLESLPAIDFTSHAVIAAVRTCQPYSAFDIQIDRVIQVENGDLFVYTELRSPAPGRGAPAVDGSSFHIISIPWSGPGADETTVELVTYVAYY